VSIAPDTKDWTWVLERPCPECGVDVGSVPREEIADRARGIVAPWQQALGRGDATERPAPAVWSVVEYGCHVRDVNRLFAERLRLMLTSDDPLFANWDQDATAVAERYGEQDPAVVAEELTASAEAVAGLFASVPDDAWQRPGRRSNGSVFTVESLGRYYLHDVLHHLHDVGAA
jgi:DinB superfamily